MCACSLLVSLRLLLIASRLAVSDKLCVVGLHSFLHRAEDLRIRPPHSSLFLSSTAARIERERREEKGERRESNRA